MTHRQQGTHQVRYGEDPSQYAELTLPEGTPRGVVVVIHGGFWKAEYGIEYARPMVPSLVDAGWAAWAIEYRRVGNGGGTPQTFDDVARAIDTLRHQDLDLSTVIALGHSAGGHLATWAAGRQGPAVPITAVVSQAGVLDLVAAAKEHLGTDAVLGLLGHDPGPADAKWDPPSADPARRTGPLRPCDWRHDRADRPVRDLRARGEEGRCRRGSDQGRRRPLRGHRPGLTGMADAAPDPGVPGVTCSTSSARQTAGRGTERMLGLADR